MACVIDHLQADHQVRVLREFTDARGSVHRDGETAVLRSMELDWARQEIELQWEREGRRETLRFSLGAKTGPRSGAMREYFELGERVAEPRPPAAPPTPEPDLPRKPRRPDAALASFAGKQPPNDTNLAELRVACDCDPALHRTVFPGTHDPGITACLGCGTVTATRCIGDDGRFTGDSWHAYLTVKVPDKVHAWLSRWPRANIEMRQPTRWPMAHELIRYDHVFFPAKTRCASEAELRKLESRLAREQSTLNSGQRLRKAGVPEDPVPANLPESLQSFAFVWKALQLQPDSPLPTLLSHAQVGCASSGVAVDLLLRRPDHRTVMLDALQSSDPVSRRAGIALALAQTPPDPELASTIVRIMDGLSLEPLTDVPGRVASCGRFEALLILIAELKLASPEMFTALARHQRRLARLDAHLVKYIRIVTAELKGEPPPVESGFLP